MKETEKNENRTEVIVPSNEQQLPNPTNESFSARIKGEMNERSTHDKSSKPGALWCEHRRTSLQVIDLLGETETSFQLYPGVLNTEEELGFPHLVLPKRLNASNEAVVERSPQTGNTIGGMS
jgi:hypothetical protein